MEEIGKNFSKFEEGAKKGDCESLYWLGFCYYYGLGTEHDPVQSNRYLKQAAAQGSGKAAYELGFRYEKGVGTKKNLKKAQEWYQRAIPLTKREVNQNNDIESVSMLAHALLNGNGIEQDMEHAVRLYRYAAEQGNVNAKSFLGDCYYNGHGGIEKDYTKALEWYLEAAEQGDVFSQHEVGTMYLNGVGTEKNVDLAVEWLQKAAAKSCGFRSKCTLAWCYQSGTGVEQNFEMAIKLYTEAADSEEGATPLNNLACMYQSGQGVEKDPEKAAKLFKEAIRKGHDGMAQSNLAYLYEEGIGVKQDFAMAARWYHEAIKLGGSPNASGYLSRVLENSKSKAYRKEKSVLKGLAYCYDNGAGVDLCPEIANALREELKNRANKKSQNKKGGTTPTTTKKCVCCNDSMDLSPAALVHGETGHACFCLPCAFSCAGVVGDDENCCPICRKPIDKAVLLLSAPPLSSTSIVGAGGGDGGEERSRGAEAADEKNKNIRPTGLLSCSLCEKKYPSRGTGAPVIVHGDVGHISNNICFDCIHSTKMMQGMECPDCSLPIDCIFKQYCS